MSTQLPLPAQWAQVESRSDARERLADLRRDMQSTREAIRAALVELADRHAIPRRDVAYAMEGYADSLLGDLVYNVERDLERDIEGEDEP